MSPDEVRASVEANKIHLSAGLYLNQPALWSPDRRTVDVWCAGVWLREELQRRGVPDDRRGLAGSHFSRKVRAADDVWDMLSRTLNATLDGTLPAYNGRY